MAPAGWDESEKELIDKFFCVKVPQALSDTSISCTEASCYKFGKKLLDDVDDLQYVENQGSNSFTLISRQKSTIVQFRLKPFNMDILELAHRVYSSLVPKPIFHPGFPLPVYTCTILPGQVHFLQSFPKDPQDFPLERQLNTIRDAAAFIAKSALCPQCKSSANDWIAQANSNLSRLSKNASLLNLAPELHAAIRDLQEKISLLFDKLPWVLNHQDFAEINILVDKDGHITGVLDFDDANFRPFGTCIWGVYESFFGSMNDMKWSFFDQIGVNKRSADLSVRQILEDAFWQELRALAKAEGLQLDKRAEDAVRTAACVGAVERYFVRGMLDDIDIEGSTIHRRSLEYAKGIIPAIMGVN